jgi:hypothetical protein
MSCKTIIFDVSPFCDVNHCLENLHMCTEGWVNRNFDLPTPTVGGLNRNLFLPTPLVLYSVISTQCVKLLV